MVENSLTHGPRLVHWAASLRDPVTLRVTGIAVFAQNINVYNDRPHMRMVIPTELGWSAARQAALDLVAKLNGF